MTVCSFFLQGRCRYGEKCWNEHPRGGNRGGGGGGGGGYHQGSSGQQQSKGGGGGGFGNRVWVNPDQQKGNYIKTSSFSSGGDDWGGGGGQNDWGRGGEGRRDNIKSSEFSFSVQNRFSGLDSPSTFDRRGGRSGGGGGGRTAADEEDDRQLEIIQKDMEIWESSHQWCFSCYSNVTKNLSGFTDLSPEELRLEYYSTRASGNLQNYGNGVSQLLNQWRNRLQELKIMNPSTRTALLGELHGSAPQTDSGFGSTSSAFGSTGFGAPATATASSFSFAASNTGHFGAPSSSSGFGNVTAAPAQPPMGFGSASTPSASTFSFAAPTTNQPPASSGFGSASAFSFSSSSANTGTGFGSGSGSGAPAAAESSGSSNFGKTSAVFGAPTAPATSAAAGSEAADGLFTPESKLTQEELNQFKAKRFTLGQVPLKPPPANLLIV